MFFVFPVFFFFCLPFGTFVLSVLTALWTFSSFFMWNSARLKQVLHNRKFWWMLSFFILTVISAFLSSNGSEAFMAIEVKLTFLLFPYLFFGFDWPEDIVKRSMVSFVSGSFFACAILLIRAVFYAAQGQTDYFYYTLFSAIIHPSYFSMYLCTALSIVLLCYPKWFKDHPRYLFLSYGFSAVFILCIFLCASKLGIIAFFVIIPILLLQRVRFTLQKGLLFLLLFIAAIWLSSFLFPSVFERLASVKSIATQQIDKTTVESTGVRILIWKEALAIIQQNVWMGVGVGDANDRLYAAYEQAGLSGALEHRFNAHNQYLQSFIGMGLPGLLLLLVLTFGQVLDAIRTKNTLLLVFGVLLVMNFMVESMLQTVAGVLYVALFYCLFNHPRFKSLTA